MQAQTERDGAIIKGDYKFVGGFPTGETVRRAYDDADLIRAVEAYKFFFPTVSASGIYKGNLRSGMVPNRVYMILRGTPFQTVLTPNSDTPYAGAVLDLTDGPMAVELPPGALMCVVDDLNQRYVMDMGLPGPDAGNGGKHVIWPPGYQGEVPDGHFAGVSSTNIVLFMIRALPTGGDHNAAVDLMKTVKIYRMGEDWIEPEWIEIGDGPADLTAFEWERSLDYWRELHEVVDREPPYEPYRMNYGQLATLGIEKGKPFEPDDRLKGILENAAQIANDQMRVQSFADRRPDRVTWPDRQWEWAGKRPEQEIWDLPSHRDIEAREKWFFQAAIESPAMFRRDAGAGSLYWLGTRDVTGYYLDGTNRYRLTVPLPVPANLFWSVTIYDPETRSEILTDQGKAALRSLHELAGVSGSTVDLFFGPTAPDVREGRWIQTVPGKGWFAYFRIYGPEAPAFDGSWKPGDFVQVK